MRLQKAVLDAFPNTKDYELVFINDGSRDNTIGSLKKLKKESTQNIKIINFFKKFRQGVRYVCRASKLQGRLYHNY